MFVFWRLLLAHFIADFPLQLDSLYRLKTKSIWGSFIHSGVFILIALLLLWPFWEISSLWYFLLFLFFFHGLQDFSKIVYTRKKERDTLWLFLFDQILHIASISIVLLYPFSGQWFDIPPSSLAQYYFHNEAIIFLVFAIAVGFGGSIFIPYLEKMVKHQERVEIPPKHKYFGIFERILVLSLVAAPGYYFAFAPLVLLIRYYSRENYSRTSIVVSFISASATGIIIRLSILS